MLPPPSAGLHSATSSNRTSLRTGVSVLRLRRREALRFRRVRVTARDRRNKMPEVIITAQEPEQEKKEERDSPTRRWMSRTLLPARWVLLLIQFIVWMLHNHH